MRRRKAMTTSAFRLAVITVGMLLLARPAMAGYSVDVYVDSIPIYSVMDNSSQDSNPVVGDIQHHFVLTDAMNRWQAEGDIFAEGGYNGVPPVSTVVTDTLIEKIANVPIFDGQIDFYHHYAASGLQSHSATIDGQFDNTLTHVVGGASLQYTADVMGTSLGTYVTGLYSGAGPSAFMGGVGPVLLPTTTEHHMMMRFYLDSLGDSIEMFNSAEIHSVVPEPAGLMFAAVGAVLASRRGRMRDFV
jgi:hypothetical protein